MLNFLSVSRYFAKMNRQFERLRINLHAVAIGGQKAKSVAAFAARHDGGNLYFMHVIAVAWEYHVRTYVCLHPPSYPPTLMR